MDYSQLLLSTQLYFIWTTLHVSHQPIHHRVYTDLKFIGKCNSYYNISISILVGSHITNSAVMSSVDSHRNQNDKTAVFLINTEPQKSARSTTSELTVSLHARPARRTILATWYQCFCGTFRIPNPFLYFCFFLFIVREDTSDVPTKCDFWIYGTVTL